MPAVLSSKITTTVSHATNGQQASGNMGDLASMVVAICAERIAILEKSIQDEFNNVQNMQNWLILARSALSLLEQQCPSSPTNTVDISRLMVSNNGNNIKLGSFLKDSGFSGSTTSAWNRQQFNDATTWLKTRIDTENSKIQLSLIKMQSLIDSKEQTFAQMTAMMKKMADAMNKPLPPR